MERPYLGFSGDGVEVNVATAKKIRKRDESAVLSIRQASRVFQLFLLGTAL
jgi:hypothetical protein